MLLQEKRTTVAYRCPICGGGVMSAVGLFRLSADMIKLKCPCGKSEMQIFRNRETLPDGTNADGDGTVRLSVPCLLCPKPHTFTLRESVFFAGDRSGDEDGAGDVFSLPCPYSDINICFTGELNRVKAELARTELELLDVLEENGISDFSALHGDEQTLGDPQVREIVLYVIRELEAEGRLYCRCQDHLPPAEDAPSTDTDTGDDVADTADDDRYQAAITPEGIRVTCTRCGASALIPADSMVSAHDFLTVDSLRLE